ASIAITRDALGQVSSIQRSAPVLPSVSNAGTTSLAYDAASQVTGLTWDGLGRLTGDGTRTFVWDGASRLTQYTAGGESPSFMYDAFGNVISRTQGAASEQYLRSYAHGSGTLDVVVQGGLHVREYVHTPSGLLLYSIEGNTRHSYHYDENGNTLILTSHAGAVVANYLYSPTGEVSASGASANNPFTLGAARGALQLGASGPFAAGGSVYDSKYARTISGGATASGSPKFGALVHDICYIGTNQDASGVAEVIGQDATVSAGGTSLYVGESRSLHEAVTLIHELGHDLALSHGGA